MENQDTLVAATEPTSSSSGTQDALSIALQALTQATQALTATATQMMQAVHSMGTPDGRVHAEPSVQINVWEDDPFSEIVPTTNPVSSVPTAVNVPVFNAPLL